MKSQMSRSRVSQRAVQKLGRRLLGSRRMAQLTGDFREREWHGLIDRAYHAYGLLRAADTAKFFGLSAVTACEFGVATGNGLLNMASVAADVTLATGIEFRIVGFD